MRISDWSSDVCSSDLGPRLFVDVVDPGREQLHMTPVAHMGGNVIRRFQQPDGDAARNQMGGGGKADRAGPDDNDWPCFGGRSGRGGGDGVHVGSLDRKSTRLNSSH